MPRSNRRHRRADGNEDVEPTDLTHILIGLRHTEPRRDGLWNVQPIAAAAALKTYTCPGCGLEIAPGVAHIVTWRADGLLGDADDLAARRHWHQHCWKTRP
jgi:hypothetical protein